MPTYEGIVKFTITYTKKFEVRADTERDARYEIDGDASEEYSHLYSDRDVIDVDVEDKIETLEVKSG